MSLSRSGSRRVDLCTVRVFGTFGVGRWTPASDGSASFRRDAGGCCGVCCGAGGEWCGGWDCGGRECAGGGGGGLEGAGGAGCGLRPGGAADGAAAGGGAAEGLPALDAREDGTAGPVGGAAPPGGGAAPAPAVVEEEP